MRRLMSLGLLLCVTGLLAACQPSLSGKASQDVTPNAVTGGEIETTALDAVPGEAGKPGADPQAAPLGNETAAAQSDAKADPAAEAAAAKPAAEADTQPVAAASEPAPKPGLTEVPVALKSEQQLACEKKKGRWSKIGKGEARACIFQTRDSGKRCERESQCEGLCLARSGTCAPFKPLYGCNEILQDDGSRVTLCLD